MKINVQIGGPARKYVNEVFVADVAGKAISEEVKSMAAKGIEVSIVFVGAQKMRQINKQYRNKDCSTDVLSFVEDGFLERNKSKNWQTEEFLGEILISAWQVKKDAQDLGVSFKKELAWVIIHGILHLFGYDHELNDGEAARMRAREEKYLLKLAL